MSTVRADILDAIEVALSTSPPAGVPVPERNRGSDIEGEPGLLSVIWGPVKDEPEAIKKGTVPGGIIVKRWLKVLIECRAAGDGVDPPDVVCEPMLEWCTKVLGGNLFGGLANESDEGETNWEVVQAEHPFCLATVEFNVMYQTLVNDAAVRVTP